jgi:histidinol-phosphate phosphatase family protein
MSGVPAVFVDRDGTLNEMVFDDTHGTLDSPRDVQQVALRPGAVEFLTAIRARGYWIVVVTNQPGLAKGTLTLANLESINDRISSLLKQGGASWDALMFCPHHPQGAGRSEYSIECGCRKPKPGMLVEAAQKYNLDLSRSWMVGDGLTDVQAGNTAGCRTCLVTSLKIEQVERFFSMQNAVPSIIVPDLVHAASQIL